MSDSRAGDRPDSPSAHPPRRQFGLRLYGKIALLVLCALLVAYGAILMGVPRGEESGRSERRVVDGARTTTAVIAGAAAEPLSNLNLRELAAIFANVQRQPGVEYAFAYSADGVLLTDPPRAYPHRGAVLRDAFNQRVLSSDGVVVEVGSGLIDAGMTVRHGARRVGAVRLRFTLGEAPAAGAPPRSRVAPLGIGLALAGAALAVFLGRSIARPLAVLAAGTRAVAAGALDTKIEIETNDEFGALATSFNQMTKNLHEMAEKHRASAIRDPLTGLPNRALFMDRLGHVVARAGRKHSTVFAVVFLDVDRFKLINDSFGHSAGDQLLADLADRLSACLREGDTIARLGGDEFGLLLEDLPTPADAVTIAERVKLRLERPFRLRGHEVFVTASLGIAMAPQEAADPETLLRDADTAMYRAKNAGRGGYQVFDEQMRQEVLKTLQVQTALRHGLERREFSLAYQPIVRLRSGEVAGIEALARWRFPHGRSVAPAEFIPIAEETGLIIPLGEWALSEACRQMNRWVTTYQAQMLSWISVNLSRRQLAQADLVRKVDRLLRAADLEPSRLMLEITESAIMENAESAARTLAELRRTGITIAIDDFGTGYSSLSLLQRFPLDVVKIDRSFVGELDTSSADDARVLRAITSLARNLGLDVVAEGVERQDQARLVQELDCTFGQGHYFSHPVDGVSFTSLLEEAHAELARSAEVVPDVPTPAPEAAT